MGTSLVLLIRCPDHQRHPVAGCLRCHDAIDMNRMNQGWGTRWEQTPGGEWVSWETYQPRMSWFGPDAFISVIINGEWSGWKN